MLQVSPNRRFLMYDNGKPFFYLADTAWELFHRCSREEAEFYLSDRASKKFTTIQAVALAELDGLHVPNPYGHTPLLDDDPTRPNEDYFKHVDHIVDKANSLGLFITMLPTWGDKFYRIWGNGPEIFTPDNARTYGKWIASRYARKNIIWMLGGDRPLHANHLLVIRALAEGIRSAIGNTQLITFHPPGGEASSTFVGSEPWLDFHTTQSGHQRDRDNYNLVDRDYRRLPARPILDAEPGYEDHPNSFNPEKGWLDQHDVRKSLYWSVFAGGCGYTYGCHSIWQMYLPSRSPISWVRAPWTQAMHLPGSAQVQHCRTLVESRPYFTRVPDQGAWPQQSMLKSDAGSGPDHIRVTRCSEGGYAFAYIPSSQRVTMDMTRMTGGKVVAWWFNPRNGESSRIGEFENTGTREFYTPNTDQTGRDWVLVLDDATKGFGPPGAV